MGQRTGHTLGRSSLTVAASNAGNATKISWIRRSGAVPGLRRKTKRLLLLRSALETDGPRLQSCSRAGLIMRSRTTGIPPCTGSATSSWQRRVVLLSSASALKTTRAIQSKLMLRAGASAPRRRMRAFPLSLPRLARRTGTVWLHRHALLRTRSTFICSADSSSLTEFPCTHQLCSNQRWKSFRLTRSSSGRAARTLTTTCISAGKMFQKTALGARTWASTAFPRWTRCASSTSCQWT
mmetsp:Transcript_17612/g.35403  ORF Transcript_17612/g.35403 Transcript_17612/m.35403 type:complete len:238 (+) Transcript_17612:337-1050(+)